MGSPQSPGTPSLEWHTSSHCNGGNCVQVAFTGDLIAVRDSKAPDNGTLTYSHSEWATFIWAVKQGEHDPS
ncbi:DUF397 domain-containing protein [Planobispora longispora]|uniref:DUF397 domain-containing protein n=1 Tax=Planobispora longispora TaxID=28887 RepID=A0A8J3RGS1_9ACTN|nr:DUF397 domain-containing protein [Planobispora longispora]BFE87027.1 hypothetical protein GCM10020093_096280 [Planobispora longispora]GIH74693.1 hypothetical protein Plo01_11220 [Planobispora longispora]